MGKALIVSGGAAGSYTIKPLHNRARIEAEITRLEELLTQLNERLAELEADLLVAEVDVLDARDALNAIIDAAAADGEIPDSNELRAATADLLEASKVRDLLKIDRNIERARVLETQAELRGLGAIPLDQDQQAWCADYTESLTGEVATAEIPGEGNARIIVRPGYGDAAVFAAMRDGQLFHRPGQSSAQVFFNAAVLPGWQKWRPTYRVGTLTAVNEETDIGSVNLDAELSSAQALPVNQSATLTGVPIIYMECNAEAFEVGDRVLVEFVGRDWSSPRVIGFESSPRECPLDWPSAVNVNVLLQSETVNDSGGFLHYTETTTEIERLCSQAPTQAQCTNGPYIYVTRQEHDAIVASPAAVDKLTMQSLVYGAATVSPEDAQTDFSTESPSGVIWQNEQHIDTDSTTASTGQAARVPNPAIRAFVRIQSSQFTVELRSFYRLYDGQEDRAIPPAGCFLCASPPVFAIHTQPKWDQSAGNTTTLVDTSDGTVAADWYISQGAQTSLTVTHTETGREKIYELSSYSPTGATLIYLPAE